jgi:polysaccharide biosynthesis/export protein
MNVWRWRSVRVAFVARVLLAAVLVAVAGCAKAPQPSTNSTALVSEGDTDSPEAVGGVFVDPDSGQSATELTIASSPRLRAADVASIDFANDYRIAPLDVLEISVFQVPDLSKTTPVSSSGYISMPLIGDVAAADKTVAELEADISAKLAADYLQSPDVSVFVQEAVSQRVTIEGAVNKPGIYPTAGSTTLLQVVALAGGLDRVADNRGIVVFRNFGGKRQAAKFDFKAIRAGTADDPPILGGDVVVVDESGTKTALRTVRESISLFGLFVPFI